MTNNEKEELFLGLADAVRYLAEATARLAQITGHEEDRQFHESISKCYNAIQETGMVLRVWQDAEPEDEIPQA